MTDSMAQPPEDPFPAPLERQPWKSAMNWSAAMLLGLLFIASGVWKITDPQSAAMRMAQARVPEALSLFAAVGFGIAETVAGVFLVAPRFRRWGALLAGILLVAFIVYAGVEYNALRGEDCSCFPWIKRVVGPGFFIGDVLMLLLAALAAAWCRPASGRRSAALVAGAVVVFALVSYGVGEATQRGTRVPSPVTVDGQPYSLDRGKVFLFFFHPECMKCFADAQAMSKMTWEDARIVAVPVEQPQFAPQFLADTGLQAAISTDFQRLKTALHYASYPFGVAVEEGREKAAITNFEGDQFQATLRSLGFVR